MREIRKKSVIPIYGLAAVWLLYCLIFPLYKTWHFIVLACCGALAYAGLSILFPGKTEHVAEPVTTGNDELDALLREGEAAVSEMRRLGAGIRDEAVAKRVSKIIEITDKIFKNVIDDPSDYRKVRRFADFHLPTTIKLLHAYDRLGQSGVPGENITGTIQRIEAVLDTILESYNRLFDSLFENQALDIETDISVLETMLKKEGFAGRDF